MGSSLSLPSLSSFSSVENIPSIFLFIASPFFIFPLAFQKREHKKITVCENFSYFSVEERDAETVHEKMLKMCYYNEDLLDFYPEKNHYNYTTRLNDRIVYQQFIVLSRP